MWKTNCSYILGLWVLQAFEMEKSDFQLQIGNWILNVSFAVPEEPATCCNASPRSAGMWPARQGNSTSPRSGQDGASAAAPATMLLRRCSQRARDAHRGFEATV